MTLLGFTDLVHVWGATVSSTVVYPVQGPYGDPFPQSPAAATNPFTFDPDAAWAELQQLRALFASPVMAEPLGASPTAAAPPIAALQQPAPEPAPPLDNAKARYRRNGLASQLRALKVRSGRRSRSRYSNWDIQFYRDERHI